MDPKEGSLFFIAPSGFGKSFYAAQEIRRLGGKAAWLSFPAEDSAWNFGAPESVRDLQRRIQFSRYLLSSLSAAEPRLGKTGLETEEALLGEPTVIVESLLAFASEFELAPIIVCFDGFETVQSDGAIVDAVVRLCRFGGPHFRGVVTSQIETGLRTADLEVRNLARVVRQPGLAFRPEDVASLVKLMAGAQILDEEEARVGYEARVEEEAKVDDDEGVGSAQTFEMHATEAFHFANGWPIATALWIGANSRRNTRSETRLTEDSRRPTDVFPPTEDSRRPTDVFPATEDSRRLTDVFPPSEDFDSLVRFADEYFIRSLPSDFVEALVRTSPFSFLNQGRMVASGMSEGESSTFLDSLLGSSIPSLRYPERTVSLHPIVREAARRRLRRSAPPQHRDAVLSVSTQLGLEGRSDAAIDLLISEELYDDALDTIRSQNHELLQHIHRMGDWVRQFPSSFESNPVHVRAKALQLLRDGEYDRALALFARGIEMVPQAEDRAALWSIREQTLAARSTPRDPLRVEQEGDTWKTQCPELSPGIDWLVAHIYSLDLRHARALKLINHVLEQNADSLALPDRLQMETYRFKWRIHSGEPAVPELVWYYRTLDEKTPTEVRIVIGVVVAEALLLVGRLQEAEDHLKQLGDSGQLYWNRQDVALLRGICYLRLGREKEAQEAIDTVRDSVRGLSPAEELTISVGMEYFARQVGMSDSRIESRIESLADQVGDLPPEPQLGLLAFRAGRANGVGPDALLSARRMLEIASERDLLPWQVTGGFFLAKALFAEGDIDQSNRELTQALDRFANWDSSSYPFCSASLSTFVYARATLLDHQVPAARRLLENNPLPASTDEFRTQIAQQSNQPGRIEALLNAAKPLAMRGLLDSIPAAEPLAHMREEYAKWAASSPLPLLTIRVFGGFEVRSRSSARIIRRTASRRILQLLLLAHGDYVHEERLIDLCWPDRDIDSARRSLQTTMNELRKDLDSEYVPRGNSYILFDDGAYAVKLPTESSVDLFEFDDAVKTVRSSSTLTAGQMREVERVLEFSRSELLPGPSYEDFVVRERERIETSRKAMALRLADILCQKARAEEAETLLKEELRLDPLWEEGVESLVLALLENSRVATAIRTYREYETALHTELELEPGERLKALLARLRS